MRKPEYEHEQLTRTNQKQDTRPAKRMTTPNTASAGRVTTPNAAPAGRVTTPNAAPAGRVTTPNTAPANVASTARRTTPTPQVEEYAQIISISNLPAGTYITSEIMITERLNTAMQGGESIMYKCKLGSRDEDYVLKIFQRQIDDQEFEAKEQLIEALEGVQHVAPVMHYGRYGGNYYEVIPYYKNGSLADRLKKGTLSEAEIRNDVLPKLNAALHGVHQAGIIHADIKPSNVLYSNDGKDFVLIDFGISRRVDERRFVTTAGKSADYAAPEVQLNRAAKESDYFSLGISLYELFVGKTPTADVSDKDVAFTLLLQNGGRIRKKQGMSDNFYALLLQLTYQFIATEKPDYDFPANARWSYDQVEKWLSVEEIPEEVLRRILRSADEPELKPSIAFAYNNTICNSLNELIMAMSRSNIDTAYHYAMAAQDSFSAALEAGSRSQNTWTREAMLAIKKKYRMFKEKLPEDLPKEEKLIMFYYTFAENLDVLFLPTMDMIMANNFEAAGKQILNDMCRNQNDSKKKYQSLLTRGILQSYLLQRDQNDMLPAERRVLDKLDELSDIARNKGAWETAVFALGYILAGNEPYRVYKSKYTSIMDLTEKLAEQEDNPEYLTEMVYQLVTDSNTLENRFAGWLISLNVPYYSMLL